MPQKEAFPGSHFKEEFRGRPPKTTGLLQHGDVTGGQQPEVNTNEMVLLVKSLLAENNIAQKVNENLIYSLNLSRRSI